MLLNRRISSILPSSSWRKCLSTVEASKAVGEEQKKTRPVRTRSKEKLAYLEAFRKRNAELEEKAKNSNLPWRIMGATILHRYPFMIKQAPPEVVDFTLLQDEVEMKQRELLLKGIEGSPAYSLFAAEEPSLENYIKEYPVEYDDGERLEKITDRHSAERRPRDSLYLIVKRNRKENSWQFPQGKYLETEHLRQTAKRIIDRAIGPQEPYFLGAYPVGHFCYEYPKEVQEKRKNFGAKIFFFRAQNMSQQLKLERKLYTDYAWVARDEIHEYFEKDIAEFLKKILPF